MCFVATGATTEMVVEIPKKLEMAEWNQWLVSTVCLSGTVTLRSRMLLPTDCILGRNFGDIGSIEDTSLLEKRPQLHLPLLHSHSHRAWGYGYEHCIASSEQPQWPPTQL